MLQRPEFILVSLYFQSHPYVMAKESANNTQYEGFLIDILDEAFSKGNCSYDVIARNNTIYGNKEGDAWTGIIGDVFRKVGTGRN